MGDGRENECPICMETLGSSGGVQALGCMDTFCQICIAIYISRQRKRGDQPCCPLCKYEIPAAEVSAFGPLADLDLAEESDEEDDENEGGAEDESESEEDYVASLARSMGALAAAALHSPPRSRSRPQGWWRWRRRRP